MHLINQSEANNYSAQQESDASRVSCDEQLSAQIENLTNAKESAVLSKQLMAQLSLNINAVVAAHFQNLQRIWYMLF